MNRLAVVYETHYKGKPFVRHLEQNLESLLEAVPSDCVWVAAPEDGNGSHRSRPDGFRAAATDPHGEFLRRIVRESGASILVRVKPLDAAIPVSIIGKFIRSAAALKDENTIAYADFDEMGLFASFLEAIPRKPLLGLDPHLSLKDVKERLYYLNGFGKQSYWFDFEDRVRCFEEVLPTRYRIPGSINVETSRKCPLRCKMCWTSGVKYPEPRSEGTAPFMSLPLYRRLIAQILDGFGEVRPILNMSFRGEPLLNKNLPEMIQEAEKHGIKVLLVTNAMVMTEELSRRLLEAGLWEIAFSVNSHDPLLYSQIQRGGDFARVMRNIEGFLRAREQTGRKELRVCYRAVLQKDNETQMEEMIARFFTPEIFNITFQCEILRPRYPHGGGRAWKRFHELPQRVPCWNLWWNCTVTTDGNVLPCVTCTSEMEGEVMGNILESDLVDIWHNGLYQRYRDLHLHNRIDEVPFCRSCDQAEVSNWSNNPVVIGGVEHLTYPVVRALRRV